MTSLWRAYAVDRAYYWFWATMAAVLVGIPAVLALRELRAIRVAVEALAKR